MPRIGIGIDITKSSGGINWSFYWATLISATVENAAPTHVVLTFPSEGSSVATDITCTVNGVARAVSSASWTGGVWTVVLASAVECGDMVVVTFVPSGGTANVTNNVVTYVGLVSRSIGFDGLGVAACRMQVSSDITVTLGDNAKFYSDAAGTLGESATWTITSGALRVIYIKCPTETATITFSDSTKIIRWGDTNDGWGGGQNAPRISVAINRFTSLQYIGLAGFGNLTGNCPIGLTYLRVFSQGITWSMSGSLPLLLTTFYIVGSNFGWTFNGALPSGINFLYLNSTQLNWTGLDVGKDGNITFLGLENYRQTKMSSDDMITLLTQLTNRTGTLPATITINDYADFAAPPAGVVTAVNTLKAAKSITTVNLGA